MKITPTPPSPVKGEERSEGAFSYKPPYPDGAQRKMKMPHVFPGLIRNPGINDWIPAYAGMTMYFHINLHCRMGNNNE